jgi:hypothetical protein
MVLEILESLERGCKEETDIVLTPEIAYELVCFIKRVQARKPSLLEREKTRRSAQ